MSKKRQQDTSSRVSLSSVHCFKFGDSTEDILACYKKYQIVLIKKCVQNEGFGIEQMRALYASESNMMNETFSMEAKTGKRGWSTLSSEHIFGGTSCSDGAWYASFIAQMKARKGKNDAKDALNKFKQSLPMAMLPFFLDSSNDIEYTLPIWVFVGKNESDSGEVLHGRPEHIDSVAHDGTWHMQSSGTKWWYIRPADTTEWGESPLEVDADSNASKTSKRDTPATAQTSDGVEKFKDGIKRLRVVVDEGDILIINTRVWWHQTRIPPTPKDGYSISYAIDFFCPKLQLPGNNINRSASKASEKGMKSKYSAGDADDADYNDKVEESDEKNEVGDDEEGDEDEEEKQRG